MVPTASHDDAGDWVVVGRVGRAHGIRGDVAVDVRTDEPERRFADGAALRTPTGQLTVASSRMHSGRLLVRFEELADRTAAEAARGTELRVFVDPEETPADPEEFYDHQLVGLRVVTTDGAAVGELLRVEHHGAQDLLVIGTDRGEVLFPFVSALVPEVDLDEGRLVVDDAPGLLDLE
ncbi:ribosome maturation factor RimM [Marmoricola sp. Leaf446]|uniref:ribosome maturation factor RimM n=1 Tax=Marmoricola sp. Leaf446 TaxID=1736379 RepID=UPI000A915EA9|nr:ribosome maturation factor RimM [Marmoricola sp. Leaf446]